jgi:DNA polymerase (family X)
VLDRAAIVARLREISQLLEIHGGNKFKARAFSRGARALEASREPVTALVEEKRLTDLPGIGHALARQIEELLRTGRSELLESLRTGLPSGVVELSQVGGIGLHALKSLHEELGISTVADLRKAAEEGRLREVKGFGEKKEKKLLDAIKKYESAENKKPTILLAEGLRLADSIEDEMRELPSVESVHLVGSLRRGMELSADVDFLVGSTDPRATIAAVAKMPRIGTVESKDDRSCRLRLPDGTRIDVLACEPKERGLLMVATTGTKKHLEDLCARAEERGVDLERVHAKDEADIYRALDLAFIPPELREGLGEVALTANGETWDDLVTADDVRGFTHCHSTWSDGRHSIEQMAKAAEARGASFITITDHSAAAHYAGGLDVERLERQWDEIDEVQERVKIRILKGTEADILADGAIDWPDKILERLDVIIASIHNRFRQDEEKMTARLLRAMQVPVFKIWGHPLGRLVRSRPPIPARVEEVLDALAESRGGGAIEINGDPHRLDLEPKWVRKARERNLPFVLSVDAHSMPELGNVRYAALLARRAGVRKSEVLNARTAAAFAKAVRPTGAKKNRAA